MMSNEEAAKKLVELYGLLLRDHTDPTDPKGEYAEAIAMAAAALVYSRELRM